MGQNSSKFDQVEHLRSMSTSKLGETVKFWEDAVRTGNCRELTKTCTAEVYQRHLAWCEYNLNVVKMVQAERIGKK